MEHISKAQVKWIRSLKQKKVRDENHVFVAEGSRCIEELRRYFPLKLLVTPDNATQSEIEQMSSQRTPQGMIGVFFRDRLPSAEQSVCSSDDFSAKDSLILVLDSIQDPGNLGTIIRTCDWYGVKQIVCSAETADCFNPKVVQATMGALGRVKIVYTDLPEYLHQVREKGGHVVGTLLDGEDLYHSQENLHHSTLFIVMGNEGNGISDAVRQELCAGIRIPSYPREKQAPDVVESLNVSIATAIILSECRRN